MEMAEYSPFIPLSVREVRSLKPVGQGTENMVSYGKDGRIGVVE